LFGSDSRNALNPPKLPELGLIERIGFGAYGEVWLGYNLATGARRAVKIVYRASFSDNRPFEREFEGIKKFDTVSRTHPSQLSLFQIGKNDEQGYFYYAMELADSASDNGQYRARTLRADLENGRLPAERALDLATALAEALAHLHSNGLIHRDVKPSNIIYVNGRPKLADIGLVTDGSGECTILGTEGYLAADCAGTPKADIYALGKVLYEAVTGMDRREFPKLPQDLRSWEDSELACELNEIVLKACATDPKQRYTTAEDLLRDLQTLSKGKSIRQKRVRRCVLLGIVGSIVSLGLLACLVVLTALWKVDNYEETNALGPLSSNEDANKWWHKGSEIIWADDYLRFPTAYTNLHKAIDLDPKFVRPYVSLLELLVRENMPGVKTETNELRKVRDKLVELAPKRASAYTAQGIFDFYWFHFRAAENDFIQATRRDPNYELGHTAYAFVLHNWARTRESREQIKMSESIVPSKSIVYRILGHTYYADRDFRKAIEFYQKTLEMQDHHSVANIFMGNSYRALGDYRSAITNYERADFVRREDTPEMKDHRKREREALEHDGSRGYWEERWRFERIYRPTDYYDHAVTQMHLGQTDRALDLLEKSYEMDIRDGIESDMICLLFDEHWDGIRDNQRFKALLEKLGYPEVMKPRRKSWSDAFEDWIYGLRRKN
jgi:serine/threonine protein kinase